MIGPVRSSSRGTPAPASASVSDSAGAEVVLIMGIPGAGKTRLANGFTTRGYVRLNRDERGGGLRALAAELDGLLADGARRVVLDNTYLTRAARSYVVDVAGRHRLPTRCVWLQTPLAQAQVNLVERLLAHFGSLPTPEELRTAARREPGLLAPTQQMRALRELEPPSADEGFAAVEVIEFAREARPGRGSSAGVLVAAGVLERPGWERTLAEADPGAPHLVFDWRPEGEPGILTLVAERVQAVVSGTVEAMVCPHGGGPPRCWCRPPLPGLPLAFAHTHGLDPARCTLIGTSPAHRTLAATLGARYIGS